MPNLLQKDTIVLPPYVEPDSGESVPKYGGFPLAGGTVPPAYRPDSGSVELLWAFRVQLVTSGAVTNRFVSMDFRNDGGDLVYQAHPTSPQGPGQTMRYHWHVGLGEAWEETGFGFSAPLPGLILLPGWSFTIGCVNEDAADVFGASQFVIWQFRTGQRPEDQDFRTERKPVQQPVNLQ